MPAHKPPRSVRSAALAFPGQGGDWGAGIRVLAAHPHHPLVQALAERLGTDRWDELDGLDTRNAQPVIYTAGLVQAEAVDPRDVIVVLGHSLGEITAAAWAGSIDPVAGLDLMVARAALGHEANAVRPSAMAAIMRWAAPEVEWLRRTILSDAEGVLEVAVRNSPTQFVLSGDVALVEAAVAVANGEGAVARVLPIDGAYHCQLLAAQVPGFDAAVSRAVTLDPSVPLVGSTIPGPWTAAEDIAMLLVRSLVLPVDWPAAVATAAASGATCVLDAGPGDTLTRLARFIPDLPVVPVS